MAVGQGTITASVCEPLVWGSVSRRPRSVFSSCSTRSPRFRAPQRAGEAGQDERPVAEAAQVGGDRRQDLPQDAGGRRGLLARAKPWRAA